jgi:hypothetical protein
LRCIFENVTTPTALYARLGKVEKGALPATAYTPPPPAGLTTTLGTAALAATGALDLANGFQLRWGIVAGSTTGTYHHAFSHGAFVAVANCSYTNSGGTDVAEVVSVTQTALNVVTSRADVSSAYSTGTWWYIAIGY